MFSPYSEHRAVYLFTKATRLGTGLLENKFVMMNSTKKLFAAVLLIAGGWFSMYSEDKASPDRMEWFKDAKLGIFIHWGPYAVLGVEESWSFFNSYLSYEDYMKQLDGFTAVNYDPEQWADLIKESGARYAVLTSKHHDGLALWDTGANELNAVDSTPAGRDLVMPFVSALRDRELKVGLYYSLMDWSHPDFPIKAREQWEYRPADDPKRWARFMDFNFIQYQEIADQFNPDLWWFDGHWWFTDEDWRVDETAELIMKANPKAIINSRLPKYGDYYTPEQGLPLRNLGIPWELCITMNESWGYQPHDKNYKSTYDIISLLADCVHLGGNLLLDIGPKADGTIPEEQVERLKGLGRWTKKHERAIFETRPGIALNYFNGPSSIGDSSYLGRDKGGDILYLFLSGKPNGSVRLKGLVSRIMRAWVVGNGSKIQWRQDHSHKTPGIVYLDVSENVCDPDMTVLAILLDGPVEMQSLEKIEDY
jgi:alpha-L-fucosidase